MSSVVRRLDPFRPSGILVVESKSAANPALDTCRMLRGLGYRAESAPSSRAALECVHGQPGHHAVVLADVLLPDMDGGELVERLRGTGTRVVLMTNRARDGERGAELLAAYPGVPVLEKPLTLSALYGMLAVRLALPPMGLGPRKTARIVRPPRRSGERRSIR